METSQQPRLLDQVRERCRTKHYSLRTEQAYTHWIRRFILFHGKRHPRDMGAPEVEAFLTYLAVRENVAASTQNQALAAILFLYREVLGIELPWLDGVTRAKKPPRLPVVLTRDEVRALLAQLDGVYWLLASLMYGSGLRLMEALRLRVKDVDLERLEITVREGKGSKDRRTMLPDTLIESLARQRERVRAILERDTADGVAPVWLPHALERKYPSAGRELAWQFMFPASQPGIDPLSGLRRRHHLHDSAVQRAIKSAVRASGIIKPASSHTLRHSFATHLLESGYDIRTVQDKFAGSEFGRTKCAHRAKTKDGFRQLLGHKDVTTTQIYTHVLNRGGKGVRSPLDAG